MKKLIQITLVLLILSIFSVKIINAQFFFNNSVKADRLNDPGNITRLAIIDDSTDKNEESILQNSESFVSRSNIRDQDQNEVHPEIQPKETDTLIDDLLIVDEEEENIQFENWMLNPCEWL